nr:NADH dehydrogenase [ubiquinone] 1 alpha subcomplex subunit 3 isoform X3 [Vicugna pacos]
MRRNSVPNGPCFPELTTLGVFVNEEAGEEAEEDEDDDENDSSGPWWKGGDLLPPSPESTRARRIALDVRYQGPTLAPRTNQESSSSSASQCTWAADLTAKYSSVSSHSTAPFPAAAAAECCSEPVRTRRLRPKRLAYRDHNSQSAPRPRRRRRRRRRDQDGRYYNSAHTQSLHQVCRHDQPVHTLQLPSARPRRWEHARRAQPSPGPPRPKLGLAEETVSTSLDRERPPPWWPPIKMQKPNPV